MGDLLDALNAAENEQTQIWLSIREIEEMRRLAQESHRNNMAKLDKLWRTQRTEWTIAKARVDDLAAQMDKEFLG